MEKLVPHLLIFLLPLQARHPVLNLLRLPVVSHPVRTHPLLAVHPYAQIMTLLLIVVLRAQALLLIMGVAYVEGDSPMVMPQKSCKRIYATTLPIDKLSFHLEQNYFKGDSNKGLVCRFLIENKILTRELKISIKKMSIIQSSKHFYPLQ